MTAAILLRKPEAQFPTIMGKEGPEIRLYLHRIFRAYLDQVRLLSSGDDLTAAVRSAENRIATLMKGIIRSVTFQLAGKTDHSFREFETTLRHVSGDLRQLCSSPDIADSLKHLYRMRIGNLSQIKRDDIFHIPFEKRQIVRSQRFSIPGLPCLYLGGSLYVCWEEMDRPPMHRIHVSRFAATGHAAVQILDFAYRPNSVADLCEAWIHSNPSGSTNLPLRQFLVAYAVCWPLIAACSIRSGSTKDSFRSHYVVPQLVLQWITANSEWDGVRYSSTRVEHEYDDPGFCANYVFPPKSVRASGFCRHLKKAFYLSVPISWTLAKQALIPTGYSPNDDVHVAFAPTPARYGMTEFGTVERAIGSISIGPAL